VLRHDSSVSGRTPAGIGRARRSGFAARAAVVVTAAAAATGAVVATASASSSHSSHKGLKSLEFVSPLPDVSVWHKIGQCMGIEAKKLGIPFTLTGPGGSTVSAQFMTSRIDQAIADHEGGIVTFPLSAPEFDPLFAQARKAGVEVATLEGADSTTGQNIDIGTSYTFYGQLAAKTISKRKGEQYVAFIEPFDEPPSSTFIKAFTAAAAKLPNVKVVTSQYDSSNVTNDVDIATNIMTAHPQVNMFVTDDGLSTAGIVSAIEGAKKVGKVFVTTNNISGAVDGLKAGVVYEVLLQNMCQIGTLPVEELEAAAEGKKIPKEIATDLEFATKSNYKKLTASGDYQ